MARHARLREFLLEWGHGPSTVSRPALLANKSDRNFRQMIHALVGYANCVLAVRDCFAAHLGITGVQYEILMVVYRLHGAEPCTVSEIALRIHRTIAFITNETKKLAALGLIDKQQDPNDRRRNNLTVTRRGVAQLMGIAPVQRRLNDALFESLSARDFEQLCALYEKLPICGEKAIALVQRYRTEKLHA
jgi:DNA-binding MarR family transcriptional regulator